MIYPGLVSVTFRQLTPDTIIQLAAKHGLQGIEWGGDVHAPHGETAIAQEIGEMTREYGLAVAAYGSYYRLGARHCPPFELVLRSAVALKAPVIRIWAGQYSSEDADEDWWKQVITDTRQVAGMAADHGIAIAFEFHSSSLTDTPEAALRLMVETDHPNVGTYWQPPARLDLEQRKQSLQAMLPWLRHLHVNLSQRGLELVNQRAADWAQYLSVIHANQQEHAFSGPSYAMLEFVYQDSSDQLGEDAKTLRQVLGS